VAVREPLTVAKRELARQKKAITASSKRHEKLLARRTSK
jgi:hypothetical protein